MPYELTFSLSLGVANAGLTDLRAQLVDDVGADVGAAISTGFADIGQGFYTWNYTSIPDGHRGAAKFYSDAAPAVFLSLAAINPEEAENTDVLTSTRSSHTADSVWSVATRELTSFGTLTTDTAVATWTYITRTLTSGGSGGATVAEIWDALTSTITTSGSIGKLIIDKLNLITEPIVQTQISTADITITRAVTLEGLNIPGITVPGAWTKCYFTVKANVQDDLDSESVIQIVVTNGGDPGDGLLYLNGSGGVLAEGLIVVGVDSVTITIEDNATALLEDCQGLEFDVKFLISGTSKSVLARQGIVDVDLTATWTV